MLPTLPNPRDYGVSVKTGFLPEVLPLESLPAYFQPWEKIAQNLSSLLLTKRVRMLVDRMPLLDAHTLKGEAEWQRACSILGFIAHAYVWSRPNPVEKLPKSLATPWLIVSDHFGLPPISSYAGLCLWNFRQLFDADAELLEESLANQKISDSTEGPETAPPLPNWLDSLATLTTFTGSMDESWFYLVSIAIERQGAPCIQYGLDAIQAVRDDQPDVVILNLQKMAENIDGLVALLGRMNEMCDPHVFYFNLRPFLAGWKNMSDAGLPNGVWYGDEPEPRQYSGGSNAQSSLIQVLDIILNVDHHPTGDRRPPSMSKKDDETAHSTPKPNFLREMRKYMPKQHRDFLEHLERVAEIREYVVENSDRLPALSTAYDACLAMLRGLRTKHIQIVTRYIIMMSRANNTEDANGLAKNKGTVGTGGTTLLPFLKQARDEVGDASAGDWGRRLLTTVHPQADQKDPKSKKSLFTLGHW